MSAEHIASRKDARIRRLRRLGREREYRSQCGEFLCDGEKLLSEALQHGAEVTAVLYREKNPGRPPEGAQAMTAPDEVFDYASPLVNSPGPLFTAKRRPIPPADAPERVMVLENVQDPGNVGTVLRTAAALGTELVILTGECADPWNPKTVRAAMGALFRQPLLQLSRAELAERLREWELPLYGAALSPESADVRTVSLHRAAVAVGNEGNGLSEALLDMCEKKIIIPMTPGSESLNAAVAASLLMWEMARH